MVQNSEEYRGMRPDSADASRGDEMKMQFTKMQGCGNDYIYFDCLQTPFPADPAAASRRLSDRHFGIGGDGIVLILPSERADFRMRIFNADGSEAPMCGNASRCVGRFVYTHGYTGKTAFTLDTNSGIKQIRIHEDPEIRLSVGVDLGRASFVPEDVPAVLPCPPDAFTVNAEGIAYPAMAVSVGTAHCVIFTGKTVGFPLEETALRVTAAHFPQGVNTEILLVEKDGITARVYERGSGETMACGTGASASVAAAVKRGLFPFDTPVPVHMPGGTITVTVAKDYSLLMEGATAEVFTGTVDL